MNDTLVFYIDGASKGNPGPSGAGVYCETVRIQGKVNLGNTTNNVAEWNGLIIAIRMCNNLIAQYPQYTKALIYTDSKLVCQQFNGVFKIKDSKMKDLYDKAISFLRNPVDVVWIPRNKNTVADELANEAITLTTHEPVYSVRQSLCNVAHIDITD